jgi:nitrate reductase NapE component
MGRHSPPIDGTVTANGHALAPFTFQPPQPRGPVSAVPQQRDDPGHLRTEPDRRERRRADGTAFIVVALFTVAQVAVVAFSGSWQHQYELSIQLGQAHWVAGMQPLSVEGLIASATLVIWYAARYKCGIPLGAYLVLAAGVGQTVLMNLGADYRWPWLGPEISVWPAVAFVAAYEMAVWLVRKRQDVAARAEHDAAPDDAVDDGRHDGDDDVSPPSPDPSPVPPPSPPRSRQGKPSAKTARALAVIRRHPGLSDAQVAAKAGVSESTARRARNAGSKP